VIWTFVNGVIRRRRRILPVWHPYLIALGAATWLRKPDHLTMGSGN
jgi:hypothetical protein